jgi:hypothetical protein
MSRSTWLSVLILLTLSGCNKSLAVDADGTASRGRYSGIGTYPADRLWAQRKTGNATSEGDRAALADDGQIIVVVDTQSGEVRQCGNNSGQCVRMSPWSQQATPSLPATLTKHAADLDAEAARSPQNVTEANATDR